jgi:biofilm protein TabA
MILDSLNHTSSYLSLGGRIQAAFDYLKNFDQATPDGRLDLDGDKLYALVQTYETEPFDRRVFESHRRYADIQYILFGREIIHYAPSGALNPKAPYDTVRDVTFYEDSPGRAMPLEANEFVILWPQDGHKPGCVWDTPVTVRKIVLKILLPMS